MLGGLFGGAAKPFTDTADTYLRERGQTRRTELTTLSETEQRRLETTASIQAGSSTWRPKWMHTIRRLLRVYFYLSFLGGTLTMVMLISVFMEQIQYSQWMQIKDDLVWFFKAWATMGGSLITVATWSFLGYSPFRSMYDKNDGKVSYDLPGSVGKAVKKITGRDEKPPVVIRENAEAPSTIEQLDGVTAPSQVVATPAPAPVFPARGQYKYGTRSKRRLARAHPDLQQLFHWLIERTPHDIGITETTREIEAQRQHVKTGRSQTMNSRHLERPAMAVDFHVIKPKKIDGKLKNVAVWDIHLYREVTDLAKIGAEQLGISITCGIDWKTLVDGPHIELNRAVYPYKRPDFVLS